jgi:copper resistance protein B
MKTSLKNTSLIAGIALALAPTLAHAQHAGHGAPPAATPVPAKKAPSEPAAKPAAPKATVAPVDHAAMGHAMPSEQKPASGEMDHAAMGHDAPTESQPDSDTMDHSAMGHAMPSEEAQASEQTDHAAMGHAMPSEEAQASEQTDHAAMGHAMPSEATPATGEVDHAAMGHTTPAAQDMQGMDHAAMGHATPAPTQPREPIPPLTDADRQAAFPDVAGHAVHDRAVNSYFLFNRLEAWDAEPGTAYAWEGQGWIGGDINRLWLRSEGERVDGETEAADLEVLYGRGIARWWDLVAGVRHDFKPGESQSFAAIGVVGLAPQKFEVEATAYLGERGQTAARFEAEYELLLTNRLILQPLVEVNVFGKNDPARGIGSGLSSVEVGLRLRYEFTRKFAPYIGVVRERAFGNTADLRRDEGEDIDDTRVVFGLRTWF